MGRVRHANAPSRQLSFPSLSRERERAGSIFGIDIEASFRDWMTDLIGEERANAVREQVAATRRLTPAEVTSPDLASRERECLTLMACGYTKREVGEILCVGEETVKSHLKNVYPKLRVQSITHAILLAALIGELDADLLREHAFRGFELRRPAAAPRRPIAA